MSSPQPQKTFAAFSNALEEKLNSWALKLSWRPCLWHSHTLRLICNCFMGFLWHGISCCSDGMKTIFLWHFQPVMWGEVTRAQRPKDPMAGKGQKLVSCGQLCLFLSHSAAVLFPLKTGNEAVKITWNATTCPTWERRNFFRERRLYGSVEQLNPGHVTKCALGMRWPEPTANTAWHGAISVQCSM